MQTIRHSFPILVHDHFGNPVPDQSDDAHTRQGEGSSGGIIGVFLSCLCLTGNASHLYLCVVIDKRLRERAFNSAPGIAPAFPPANCCSLVDLRPLSLQGCTPAYFPQPVSRAKYPAASLQVALFCIFYQLFDHIKPFLSFYACIPHTNGPIVF